MVSMRRSRSVPYGHYEKVLRCYMVVAGEPDVDRMTPATTLVRPHPHGLSLIPTTTHHQSHGWGPRLRLVSMVIRPP